MLPGSSIQVASPPPNSESDASGSALSAPREFFQFVDSCFDTLLRDSAADSGDHAVDQTAGDARRATLHFLFIAIAQGRRCLAGDTLHLLTRGRQIHRRLLEYVTSFSGGPASGVPPFHDATYRQILGLLTQPEPPPWLISPSPELLGTAYEYLLARNVDRTSGGAAILPKSGPRKSGGRYYTPATVIEDMLSDAVDPLLDQTPAKEAKEIRILDPACGGGAFLIRTFRRLAARHGRDFEFGSGRQTLPVPERLRILQHNIFGVDIDPQAVEVTRLSLVTELLAGREDTPAPSDSHTLFEKCREILSTNIRCGNALVGRHPHDPPKSPPPASRFSAELKPFDWQTEFSTAFDRRNPGFDIVLGNPPYVDSEAMTARWKALRDYCASHYRTARGNWDLFCVFVERAMDVCRDGGRVCLLVPNKLASAEYAASVRQLLVEHNRLVSVRDYSQVPLFNASVYPLVFLAAKEPPRPAHDRVRGEWVTPNGPGKQKTRSCLQTYGRYCERPRAPWSILLDRGSAKLLEKLRQFPTLAAHARVLGAATVAEAYDMKPLISEAADGRAPDCRVINSGTIDRYHDLWGQKRMRYLGNTYLRPVIRCSELAKLPEKRRLQAASPKIIVAGMTRRIECTRDPGGHVLAGKSTSIVFYDGDLRYLLGLLNSSLITFYYRTVFGGNQLQGGYLRIGPPQLKTIPLAMPSQAGPRGQSRAAEVVALVERMLGQYDRLAEAESETERHRVREMIAALDGQIDDAVYTMYGLSKNDRQTVEKGMAEWNAAKSSRGTP